MAGSTEPTTERSLGPPAAPPTHRRRFLSRVSVGHVIMLVAGLSAFLLVFSILRSRDETFLIATAADELRAGSTVDEDSFRYSSIGVADRDVLGTLLSPEQAQTAMDEGWIVTRRVPPGDPVRMSDFRSETSPSELRAMSIPIDRGHAVAGVLQAGDLIDVIVVRKGVAGYVATGIEVLDVAGGESQLGTSFSVTVAVDGPTSLRLASAMQDGSIDLVRATGSPSVDRMDTFDPQDEDLAELPGSPASGPFDSGTG